MADVKLGGVAVAVLGELAEGPTAVTLLRAAYGPYIYTCLDKLVRYGLASQDPRSLAYSITDEGRRELEARA